MRRAVVVAIISLAFSVMCSAQRGGFGGGRGGGFAGGRGFGGGVVRGGGLGRIGGIGGGGFRGGAIGGNFRAGGYGFRGGFGAFRGGFFGHGFGFRTGFGFRRSFVFWPYPLFIGAVWDWGYPYYWSYPYYDPYYYGYGYASYPTYSYGYAAAPSYPPVVIVNASQPAPPMQPGTVQYREETARRQNESRYQPPDYSIAFNNHQIVHAIAYWVKDGRLHYVTQDHSLHDVPLGDVDRLFSEQINRDKGVDFRLPALAGPPPPTRQ